CSKERNNPSDKPRALGRRPAAPIMRQLLILRCLLDRPLVGLAADNVIRDQHNCEVNALRRVPERVAST
ncbi:MAG: hypothetical protein ACQESR_13940, partial [Planctomycetota bacterium]